MNNELLKLYQSRWDGLCSAIQPIVNDPSKAIKPAYPLLLHVANEKEWKNADIRLMVFGQETNSWYGELNNKSKIETIIKHYKDFDFLKHKGGFFPYVTEFINLLQLKEPNKKIEVLWNNLVKIGGAQSKGAPDYINKAENKSFHVIKQELDILMPNFVLFLTGYSYDKSIENNFGKIEKKEVVDFSEKQLVEMELSNVNYLINIFRTYNPGYLKYINYKDYFNAIIKKINF